MTSARAGALGALAIGLVLIAAAGWWLRPQADPRLAFGRPVGAFEIESEDIGGTGVPIRRVSFPRAAASLGDAGVTVRVEARRLAAAIDPARALRRSPWTRPRLVQFGTADEVIARGELEGFARAVRPDRRLERYDGAPHALDYTAMRSRLRWLDRTLGVKGPAVPGHLTEPPIRCH